MHILHLYKDYAPVLGGIENHIKVLAEGLGNRGHRVTVLVTNTAPHDSTEQYGNVTIIKAARLLHMASTPLSWRMVWHASKVEDVDVIHVHFPYPPADVAALCVRGHPPMVVTYHSDIVRQKMLLRVYSPLLQYTLDHAARIVCTSPAYIHSSPWLRSRSDRCVVSPLSVDLERFAQPHREAVEALRARYGGSLVLFVGRLRYYKGLHFLLEALGLMRSSVRVLLVGTGPEEQRLRELAQALGVAEQVCFLGEVSDAELPLVYGVADVFVLPSHLRSEAFGIVQLEAQAAALPVICTELGTGTSAITQHGRTGFVVPPANPSALAQALDVLVCNPDMARHMGLAGRQRAEQEYSHSRMVERMEHIYQDVQMCIPSDT